MAYIYKITNQISGKSYVGKTLQSVHQRWKGHCSDKNRYPERPLYRAMNKYGIENFTIEEVEKCSDSEARDKECYWINFYDTYKNGYNATLGGDGISHLNYDLIVDLYQQGKTIKDISEQLNHDAGHISTILKSRNISIIPTSELNKKKFGKSVKCIELDKIFISMREAARFLIEEGYSKSSIDNLGGVSGKISQVVNGKRKTAFGFHWELI